MCWTIYLFSSQNQELETLNRRLRIPSFSRWSLKFKWLCFEIPRNAKATWLLVPLNLILQFTGWSWPRNLKHLSDTSWVPGGQLDPSNPHFTVTSRSLMEACLSNKQGTWSLLKQHTGGPLLPNLQYIRIISIMRILRSIQRDCWFYMSSTTTSIFEKILTGVSHPLSV